MNAISQTLLNDDITQRCVVDSRTLPWQPSPSAPVHQRLLKRNGGEVARATSIVRYEAAASFDHHPHELGEQILVLEGTLSDEHGDYPAGTYLQNPPGSGHAPYSTDGCTLFVKLRYLDPADTERVVINTRTAHWHQGLVPGLKVLPISAFGTRNTAMVRWAPETYFNPHRHYGGEEILVVEGVFSDEHGHYPAGSWLRSPHMSQHQPFSVEGCLIMVTTGHLLRA
ncbi:cupin domain-containing protein [Rhodoferax antarcticus]|uniref:Anti-ECFsigma factor, ChrR n=1 Tax=Rhodoferax antarcticus ANT.BR TaxID=1111071 RepID=A0A1Q8YBT2_9BURK|nr:cupin domain-containing protein [Rhodoferax antarcticus]APW46784.1 cupin [Rhodoferax antarcticus]MCW2311265.1 anti-sigma factor ChrR (cupin superfamily) [Rhodoferax antarcticus]OLP05270.1 anti-ECFsigma factor, ChrR [Rhodoferax antarcticus ANT.BR]